MRTQLDQPVEIAVVDYGMGNRRSVEKALEQVGARASVSSDPVALRAAAGLVVPGVGAFPRAMDNLRELGLDELFRERVAAGTPVLGICLGMELAFDYSTEQGGTAGLGIIPGEVQAGTNAHHMIEAAFKAFARALRQAVAIDPTETGVPSTKGTLTG